MPEVRFEGFSGKWEKHKLSDIKDVRDGTHDSPKYYNKGFPLVTSKNLKENGLDMTDVSLISEEDFQAINKRSKVDIGDVIFGMIGTIGNPVIVDRTGFAIKNVALIKHGGEIRNEYLIQLLRSPIFKKYIRNENAGNTQKFLGLSKIRDYQFLSPSYQEQTQIGTFFKQLDDTITLHQQELSTLKQAKQGFLQKMFPKEGESMPEVRFPGFTGEWGQRELGEIVNITMGQSPNGENYTENPNDHILVQGNADIKNGWVVPRVWTTQVTKSAYKGDIILSVRAPVGDVGKTQYDVVLGRGVAGIKGNEFIFQLLSKMKSDGFWARFSTGSTFESINSNNLKEAIINIPDEAEQTKIGTFFKQLDETITLHQRELDALKETKKAFLQKMFV
ncbi:Putative Type I restriction-modification system,specificity subunit S [Bacillus velezensis]|nr:Putative Type I restriction-modification system,specificity subunit S [Bacillus velezensis]